MKQYNFYGWENGFIKPKCADIPYISNLWDIYDLLSGIWSAETCPPRMRHKWTSDNPSLGQCSITAFLVQDIFGGDVYGILRSDGNYHCYNVIEGYIFDLTSEQFCDEILNYNNNPMQSREIHFKKEEKHKRYELLKKRLLEVVKSK